MNCDSTDGVEESMESTLELSAFIGKALSKRRRDIGIEDIVLSIRNCIYKFTGSERFLFKVFFYELRMADYYKNKYIYYFCTYSLHK